jgi:ribose transport system ATP-binding protein
VRAIAGADPVSDGTIWLDGRELRLQSPADAIAAGIVMVPEDRKLQGVVMDHPIGENIIYSNLDKVGRRGWITKTAVRSFADGAIRRFGVKGRAGQPASSLSGGNQQKVVIAKWLARDPRVVILDEPTRGIDVGAKYEIYTIINRLAAQGKAVLVISSELPELLGICDRIYTLAEGRITAEVPIAEATPERLMQHMTKEKD